MKINKEQDNMLAEIQKLIEAQNFKTQEEMIKFVSQLMKDGGLDSNFDDDEDDDDEELSDSEYAVALVAEAFGLPNDEAEDKIIEALHFDSECIEAYAFMGSIQKSFELSTVFFEKAISIGKKRFGGKFLKEHKGKFWLIYETRPYMNCLMAYATSLYGMGKIEDAVAIFEEMLQLNPNDNQGVREYLLLYLIELNEVAKFRKYAKQFADDESTSSLFTRALFAFDTEKESENANNLLAKAIKSNKFVAKNLLSDSFEDEYITSYEVGSKEEASYYTAIAGEIWGITPGALDWLEKRTKMRIV